MSNRNSFHGYIDLKWINSFQLRVAFDIETSHLICTIIQMTGLYEIQHWIEMGWGKFDCDFRREYDSLK